jgi:hypothetical protein
MTTAALACVLAALRGTEPHMKLYLSRTSPLPAPTNRPNASDNTRAVLLYNDDGCTQTPMISNNRADTTLFASTYGGTLTLTPFGRVFITGMGLW